MNLFIGSTIFLLCPFKEEALLHLDQGRLFVRLVTHPSNCQKISSFLNPSPLLQKKDNHNHFQIQLLKNGTKEMKVNKKMSQKECLKEVNKDHAYA